MVTCTHGALIFTARQATVIPKPNGTPKESHMTSKAKNYLSLIRWPAASLLLTHLMCKDIPTLGVRDISVMVERLWWKRQKWLFKLRPGNVVLALSSASLPTYSQAVKDVFSMRPFVFMRSTRSVDQATTLSVKSPSRFTQTTSISLKSSPNADQ